MFLKINNTFYNLNLASKFELSHSEICSVLTVQWEPNGYIIEIPFVSKQAYDMFMSDFFIPFLNGKCGSVLQLQEVLHRYVMQFPAENGRFYSPEDILDLSKDSDNKSCDLGDENAP